LEHRRATLVQQGNPQALREEKDEMNSVPRSEVYKAIDSERDYQDGRIAEKFGHQPDEPTHPVAAEILMMESYVARARAAWVDNKGVEPALHMVRKVAGLAVRCMEHHGAPMRKELR